MTVWSGRFKGRLHPEALKFSSSLPIDIRLSDVDIEGSLAHVAMLAKQKIIPRSEAARIDKALKRIRKEIQSGKLQLETAGSGPAGKEERFVAEDVHMAIEHRLMQLIGPIGGKLHTARSRNDQVALDERLYLQKTIDGLVGNIRSLQRAILSKSKAYPSVVMPGYTHLQRAQPILLAHHLLAYVAMLDRDRERFLDCLRRSNSSPLGAGALAGTSFPIDRISVAKRLGLDGPVENSIDAVSDRDSLIEFIAACSIAMMHLSRFAEELVLWSSQEWRFAEIGDAFTTGSSIMPQKKNPDMAELVRGKTGRVYGDLVALLTVMKGLPLAYNRDMQEDKEPLFDAADTLADSLRIFALMVESVSFDGSRFEHELDGDFLLATELADYLVRKGEPFRKAHAVVGGIVQFCVEMKIRLSDLSLADFREHSRVFEEDVLDLLSARGSVERKKSQGSTAPAEVAKAIRRWEKKVARAVHPARTRTAI